MLFDSSVPLDPSSRHFNSLRGAEATRGGGEEGMEGRGEVVLQHPLVSRAKLWQRTKCTFQDGPGSVRFGYGLGIERFERFRFSVPAVPLRTALLCVSVRFHREDGSGSGFGSWKTVPAVPVPRSVPAKTPGPP